MRPDNGTQSAPVCSIPALSKTIRYALLAGAALTLVQTLIWGGAWRDLLTRQTPLVIKHREEFTNGAPSGNISHMTIEGDWEWRGNALWLRPGNGGHVEIQLQPPPDARPVLVRLWLQGAPWATNTVTSWAGRSSENGKILLAQDPLWQRRDKTWSASGRVWRGETATITLPDGRDTLRLRIDARVFRSPHGDAIPILQRAEISYRAPGAPAAPPLPAMIVLCALGMWAVILWQDRARWRDYAFPLLATAALLFGAAQRWQWFVETAGHPLGPDASGFLQIIQTMTGPYDTASTIAPWVREPFFPWIGWLWFRLTPDTAIALQLLTTLLSIAAIWAAFEAGRRLVHPFAGFAAALMMAANDYLIFCAPRGLRLDLFLMLTLWLVVLFIRVWREKDTGAACDVRQARPCEWGCAWKWFAVVAALMTLTRITSLAFVLPMLLALAVTRRLLWRRVAMTLAVIAIPLLPHLMFNYYFSEERDPLFSANVHARYYRNRDFAGQPGFPSIEDARRDPYAGGPITTAQYIFTLHSPKQWVLIPLKGLVNLFATGFAYKITFSVHKPLLALYALAFLLTFAQRRWWGLGVILLLLAGPVAFVLGAGKVDPRLLTQFMPFQYFILAIGFHRTRQLMTQLFTYLRNKRQTSK